jgi:hypothetical protein
VIHQAPRAVTIEEALRLAGYQRPGRKIVMGPEAAIDAPMKPLHPSDLRHLPGFSSWLEYDCGHSISLWTLGFARRHAAIHGRAIPTPEDVAPFHAKSVSLVQAQDTIANAIKARKTDR